MTIIVDVGSQDAEVVMQDSVRNIGVTIKDTIGTLISPQELSLRINDLNGSILVEDIYSPADSRDPDPPRILNPSTGRFEFPYGLDNGSTGAGKENITTCRRDVLFTWKIKQISSTSANITIDPGTGVNSLLDWESVTAGTPGNFISVQYVNPSLPNQTLSVVRTGAKIKVNLATNGSGVITTIANDILAAVPLDEDTLEIVSVALSTGSDGTDLVTSVTEVYLVGGSDGSEEETLCENVRIITPRMCSLSHKLRLLIDKVVKRVFPSGDINEGCYLGYTEGQLIQYIEGGLQIINAYQPTGVFTFDDYPYTNFEFTLIETSLMAGVMSQQLFAIDTDIPNWSDQGNSFVLQHAQPLATYLNWLSTRLDKMIPIMKLNFVNSGSLHIETGPNMRLAALMQAAPTGSLFRNLYFRG